MREGKGGGRAHRSGQEVSENNPQRKRREGMKHEDKTYSTSSTLEHGHAALGAGPAILGHDGLEGLGGDVPELLVLGAEQDDDAVALRVERRGNVLESLLDDLVDAVDGQRTEVLGERVVGATLLDEVEDRVGGDLSGRHLG